MLNFTPKVALNLTKCTNISNIKRYYPGGKDPGFLKKILDKLYKPNNILTTDKVSKMLKPTEINKIYEKNTENTILFNKDKTLDSIQEHKNDNMVFNKKANVSSTSMIDNLYPSSNKKTEFIDSPDKTSTAFCSEKVIHSGLMTFPPEYFTKGPLFQQEFNKTIILNYQKVLYNMAKHKIYNDKTLFAHIHKLFFSMSGLHEGMNYNHKWIEMTGAITQHVLRSLFLDKKFPIEFFEEYMDYQIDFKQYISEGGDILLLIESFIAKNTLRNLFQNISFSAMNHELPEQQRPGYSKEHCQQLTGQDNADFHGQRVIVSANGEALLETYYKDAKTFDSGITKGRLSICYDLNSNQKIREYMTKITTSVKICLEKPENSLKNKNALKNFLKNLVEIQKKIFAVLEKNKKTNIITDQQDFESIHKYLENVRELIRSQMLNPEISSIINFGIGFDPGTDIDFIAFNKQHLQINYETLFTNEEIRKILYNNIFEKEEHRKLLQRMIENFPENMQDSIRKSIDYIDKS